MLTWLIANWVTVAIPLLAFLAAYVVGLWLRGLMNRAFERWAATTKWQGSPLVISAVRRPFLLWFLLLGVAVAVQVSVLSAAIKSITAKAAGSLFVLSLMWAAVVLGEQLLRLYLPGVKASQRTISLAVNVVRVAGIVVGALIVLDIWGAPTSAVLLLIVVVVLAAALVLRNVAPNLFAGFQLSATQHVKVGDYIKLETGEEGYVSEIGWSSTRIKALDESIIIVPNSQLVQHTIINYGRPLKKATEAFRFFARTHLTELTGLKAKGVRDLVEILKHVPDSVVYYHTHHFLEERHYLAPEPSNDFAVWVSDALGDEVLGERLASVNTFEFSSLGALRERLVGIVEEYLPTQAAVREAMPGREFHFMKSVSVVLPTSYVAHDLREFVEALRKISLGSLYFHVFESRLRLGRPVNDFSVWLQDSLGEGELGEEIARLDPYTYTLEGLRLTLIQLIEKRIK